MLLLVLSLQLELIVLFGFKLHREIEGRPVVLLGERARLKADLSVELLHDLLRYDEAEAYSVLIELL